MNWKIARDSYYSELFPVLQEQGIIDAGFFYDNADYDFNIADSLDIHCTPMNYVKNNLNQPNPAIIISTGSFNPIHDGHIEMMIKAKKAIELNGFTCIGGFIAPDHDEYIQSKLGAEALQIHQRIKLINKAIAEYDWLNVDCWAGIFHTNSINFTDIVCRIQLYIKKHLGVEIPIFFVCGGDNANLAKAFVKKGNAVIVSRPAYQHSYVINEIRFLQKKFNNKSNIFTIENNNDNSSTVIRKNNKHQEKIIDTLVLRVDGDQHINEFINPFRKRFKTVIAKHIFDQQRGFNLSKADNMISLDPFIPAKYNLAISRLYDVFGIQQLTYSHRPDNEPLEEQIKCLPDIDFTLFDDDIATGGTMNFVINLLNLNNKKVIGTSALTHSSGEEEILDIRDFIYESYEGGLVIKDINNNIKRVPYMYPFVCPHIRASIKDPMQFSIEMWELNIIYYQNKNMPEMVKKCTKYLNLLKKFI